MCREELLHVENALWVLAERVGLSVYDFDFARYFTCRHPLRRPERIVAVARAGVYDRYDERYQQLLAHGIVLVHSPGEHLRASELPHWYPLLEDLTPKSVWFDATPTPDEVASVLRWPIFVKGHRQTSRHQRKFFKIDDADAFVKAAAVFRDDPMLRWQQMVCREHVPLRCVEDPSPERIPSSFEFRSFWWRGQLVGIGRYWWEGAVYEMTDRERQAAVAVASEAARRINVSFLVVDVAQTADGRWIVIECNDGQESGYAGVPPIAMWRRIIELE